MPMSTASTITEVTTPLATVSSVCEQVPFVTLCQVSVNILLVCVVILGLSENKNKFARDIGSKE
jgi:hypothetical protein